MVRLIRPDRRRTRNFLSRREQWRLLLLFVPLALVIIAIGRLRDPNFANRVDRAFAQVAGGNPAQAPRSTTTQGSSDASHDASAEAPPSLPPGAFRSDDRDRKQSDENDSSGSANKSVSERKASSNTGLFPGVNPAWRKTIADSTYFRNAEKNAWFGMFGLLQQTSTEALNASHALEANYVQLVDQPNFYRGKLVTVYGYLRQITEQTPAANDLGIKSYYRIVMQPTDGSSWPVFVYCLDLPPNLSLRDHPSDGYLKVTGLFFKKLSYEWKHGFGTAPVVVAKTVEYSGSMPCGPSMLDIHPPAASDAWKNQEPVANADKRDKAAKSPMPITSFREILNLAGWSIDRLAEFDDGQTLADAQRVKTLELLRRLRSFNSAELDDWVHTDLSVFNVLKNSDDYRGQLVRLTGRVTKVSIKKPAPADAARLEMPVYYECEIALDDGAGSATILTTRVPHSWLQSQRLGEPASAVALYLKKLGKGQSSASLWLAKEIAWHPGKSLNEESAALGATIDEQIGNKPDQTFGKAILGNLGMDVGLLDEVQSRGPIRIEERNAFYQMLAAVGQIGEHQLVRFAQQNLPAVRDEWQRALAAADTRPRHALTQEVLRQAAQGRYSVAPLFNDAQLQQGRLFVFDGMARRVTRVEVGSQPSGGSSTIAEHFDLDHYYEMEVFTDNAQNHPLVFCVRDLPKGFPVGDSLREPVRVAGFFFKDWLYHAHGSAGEDNDQSDADKVNGDVDPARFAPLLIGRAPLVLPPVQADSAVSSYVGIGLFLLGLAGMWIAALIYGRSDRQFRRRTPAVDFSLPAGQSLNDLDLAAAEEPSNAEVPKLTATDEAS